MVFQAVYARIELLLEGELVADDINLFVKNEPHKEAKILAGKLRLISGISLVDSLIDRMIFGNFAMTVLENVGRTPSLLGWNPYCGGRRFFSGRFPHGVVSVDKSSWDWSVPGWMVDLWLAFLIEMHCGVPDYHLMLIRARFELLFEKAVFRSKGFRRVPQKIKGIMKSGCYLTIILNSLGQSILHYCFCARYGFDLLRYQPYCYGDDTVQDARFDFDLFLDYAKRLGFIPKINAPAEFVEFIGFLMDEEKVVPAYWRKHLFLLKYLDEGTAEETLRSYQDLYYANPEMLYVVQKELNKRNHYLIRSKEYLRRQLDSRD